MFLSIIFCYRFRLNRVEKNMLTKVQWGHVDIIFIEKGRLQGFLHLGQMFNYITDEALIIDYNNNQHLVKQRDKKCTEDGKVMFIF